MKQEDIKKAASLFDKFNEVNHDIEQINKLALAVTMDGAKAHFTLSSQSAQDKEFTDAVYGGHNSFADLIRATHGINIINSQKPPRSDNFIEGTLSERTMLKVLEVLLAEKIQARNKVIAQLKKYGISI
jgi:hypothetical protein